MDDEAVALTARKPARGFRRAGEFALGAVGFEFGGRRHGSGAKAQSGQWQRPRSFAPPSVLPDISPTWGEIGSSSAGAPLETSAIGESGNCI
ncbi:hypothetical protein EN751_20015 [Mesorhizobium sp. M4A.F.Ca.ET.029.04.2.1]|nr:hypothetical protein EN751_20015 [Mesorhizobium sp. M4A.F.Ca.ET.029.04.2.1]